MCISDPFGLHVVEHGTFTSRDKVLRHSSNRQLPRAPCFNAAYRHLYISPAAAATITVVAAVDAAAAAIAVTADVVTIAPAVGVKIDTLIATRLQLLLLQLLSLTLSRLSTYAFDTAYCCCELLKFLPLSVSGKLVL